MSLSLGRHERSRGVDDWLTPRTIIEALGPFDLDPCASVEQPWRTAETMVTYRDGNGLSLPWFGFVWCNPPYRSAGKWLERLSRHDAGGLAMVFARVETKAWAEHVWPVAEVVLFVRGRVNFCSPITGEPQDNAGAPSAIIAYGSKAAERLRAALRHGTLSGVTVRVEERSA